MPAATKAKPRIEAPTSVPRPLRGWWEIPAAARLSAAEARGLLRSADLCHEHRAHGPSQLASQLGAVGTFESGGRDRVPCRQPQICMSGFFAAKRGIRLCIFPFDVTQPL